MRGDAGGERPRHLEDGHAHRELALGDELAVGENARALDHVAQLANVAFPERRAEQPLGAWRQPGETLLQPLRGAAHERGRQVRNVLAAVAQRRQPHFDDVEAVVEVAPEPAGGDFGTEIAIGRGDHVHVDALRARARRRGGLLRAPARAAAWPARRAAARRSRRGTACPLRRARRALACVSVAPMNAPRTWPNSSLSNSVSSTAAQLTVTNGRSRRGPVVCSARAASSLPVPSRR